MNSFFHKMQKMPEEDLITIKSKISEAVYPPKTILLLSGDKAEHIYLIKKGCVRLWFNNDGADVTVQFFFEDQMVSSFESIYRSEPSLLNIETVEETTLSIIKKSDFITLIKRYPKLNEMLLETVSNRFIHYLKLFLSRISKSPEERYLELFQVNPQIFNRVPHHYIASYLGITSVSLSRIRKRVSVD